MPNPEREPVYTVAQLVAGLKRLLAERVGRIWVVGELSGVHVARSGHIYFSLKDDSSQLRCALFRSAARGLAFEPEDGLEVLVQGDVSLYEARGELQLVARRLEPRGQGVLQLAFEQLRQRLEAEGLFDAVRKRALPPLPERIGVVTSPTGAAIHDILEVTGRRFPGTPIVIAPTRVQGDGAEDEIAAALDSLAVLADVDLILLARGGGSLEDLRAFNSETVARAIIRAPAPVLCGVGHEVDVTIADLCADLRAPTPSAAAELALPDREVFRSELVASWQRLRRAMRANLDHNTQRFARERDALRVLAPTARVATQRVRFHAAERALQRAARLAADRSRAHLAELAGRLDSLSPLSVLSRGYALVRRSDDGTIVRSVGDAGVGDALSVRVAEADLEVSVKASQRIVES
ncbi:MAG: exodeoxyribonuclease VII large subunit [Deltaproteobacteria bacterium]|nr:exodeoxyribonuclease VII large subunit [Deltaproteobacteria bacterium]